MKDNKEKVLLHACCAVCMAYPVEMLKTLDESGYDPVVWFYNPNIYPEMEYLRRRDELIRYCEEKGYEYSIGDYDTDRWRVYIEGLEHEPEKEHAATSVLNSVWTGLLKKQKNRVLNTLQQHLR